MLLSAFLLGHVLCVQHAWGPGLRGKVPLLHIKNSKAHEQNQRKQEYHNDEAMLGKGMHALMQRQAIGKQVCARI
jgi:hypothetical protein